ncbi:MAG: T9SS type A sorting domain-containing protein [Aureispira sp.]|nr:T9SS type A sorting domain-containing protein [Aureispira sp.]
MKNILLTFCLNFIFAAGISQTYHPLVQENTYWEIFECNSQNLCIIDAGYRYFFKGDTIINSTQYKILRANHFSQLTSPPPCYHWAIDTSTSTVRGFLREDTLTRKVFILTQGNGSSEEILFDFTLNIGDTLNSTYTGQGEVLVIDTIVNITLLNGEIRKKWILTNGHSYIESIGGSEQFYYPLITGLGWWYSLICVNKNNTQLIGYQCTLILNSKSLDSEKPSKIYPNPIDKYLFIERKNSNSENLIIFDFVGKVIYTKKLHLMFEKIDLSSLNSGLYFYTIGNTAKGKIIKK